MSGDELKVGEYRRHTRLGTEAVYRVREAAGVRVELEVVFAPGLRAGLRVHFTAEAVSAMERLDPAEFAAPPEAP